MILAEAPYTAPQWLAFLVLTRSTHDFLFRVFVWVFAELRFLCALLQVVPRVLGALGYVRKHSDPETLIAAIRSVAAGRPYVDPSIGAQLVRSEDDERTARERDVLRRVALGESNNQLASTLKIGEETVKTHVGHLLGKLQVENRAQAVVQALKRGILSIEELDRC